MRYFRIALLLFICSNSFAQFNLVPNPSFEDTLNCDSFYYPNIAYPWYTPTNCTPDYYYGTNPTCGNSALNNPSGFQLPKSGIAYVGLYLSGGNSREYITSQINNALILGKDYYVGFNISRANLFYLATDDVGLFLSSNSPSGILCDYLPIIPQIENPNGDFLSDTINWTLVSGIYTATGGENYITIGNFKDSANTSLVDADNGLGEYGNAYYFIDDVFVIPMDSLTSSNENTLQKPFNIYPNPIKSGEEILVSNPFNYDTLSIKLYSIEGKILAFYKASSGLYKIPTIGLTPSIYLIEIENNLKKYYHKIIVK